MLLEAIRSIQADTNTQPDAKPEAEVKGLSFADIVAKLVKRKTGKGAAKISLHSGETGEGTKGQKANTSGNQDDTAVRIKKDGIPIEELAGKLKLEAASGTEEPHGKSAVFSENNAGVPKTDLQKKAISQISEKAFADGDVTGSLPAGAGELHGSGIAAVRGGSEGSENNQPESQSSESSELNSEKSRGSGQSAATLKVIDLRTQDVEPVSLDTAAAVNKNTTDGGDASGLPFRSIEIDVRPAGVENSNNGRAANSQAPALLAELRNTANTEIVKTSGIVLRDGGEGEIRLNLKPENLGNVRIRLALHDNQVTGRIVVDNSAVREVFEQNLDNLYRAFRDSGLNASGLEVTVGGEGFNRREGNEYVPGKLKRLEIAEETSAFVFAENTADGAINLVV